MTTPCDCADGDASAKLEVMVTTLRDMRAAVEVLGEQIDQMLVAAESGQNRASREVRPENPGLATAGAPEGSGENYASNDDGAGSDGLADGAAAEIADLTRGIGELFTRSATTCEQNEAQAADGGSCSQSPSLAVLAEESAIFQMFTATEAEPEQAGEKACAEDRVTPTVMGVSESDGSVVEAEVTILSAVESEGVDHIAVAETADYPRDFGVLLAFAPNASQPQADLCRESDAGSDSPAVGISAVENRADEDPMSKAAIAAEDGSSTSCGNETETEPASQAGAETLADHNVAAECSEKPVVPAGEDAAKSEAGESNVIVLASRRRRVIRSLAASVAAVLVLAGMVVATKVDTLDGLTSLAHATGLR